MTRGVLCSFLSLGLLQSPAFAQPAEAGAEDANAATPENVQATQDARTHFQTGIAHFDRRAYREAIREFELARERVQSADLWYNIARAHQELGEYDRAVEHYRRYLQDRVDPPDRERIESLILGLEELAEAQRREQERQARPTTGRLRLQASAEGAVILLDDRNIGTAPIDVPLNLQPGTHALRVLHDGDVPFVAQVNVGAGVTTAAYADLTRETRYRSIRNTPLFAWIVGGLAVVTAGTSGYAAIRAESLHSDGDLDGSRDWARTSDYLLAGAAGLAVTAVILYFIEGQSIGTERQ